MGDSRRHEGNLSLQRTSCDKQLCSPHEFPVSFFCQLCHFKSRLKNIWHFCHRQQSASHGLVRENTWVFLFKLVVDCELKLEKKNLHQSKEQSPPRVMWSFNNLAPFLVQQLYLCALCPPSAVTIRTDLQIKTTSKGKEPSSTVLPRSLLIHT